MPEVSKDLNCVKCGKEKFNRPSPGRWCRTCKYEHYDEYFGPGGVNEQAMKEQYPEQYAAMLADRGETP